MVDLGEPFVDSQTFILSTFSRGPCTWPRTVSVEGGSEAQVGTGARVHGVRWNNVGKAGKHTQLATTKSTTSRKHVGNRGRGGASSEGE